MRNIAANKVNEAHRFLLEKGIEHAEFGIILGTGLGQLIDEVEVEISIDYQQIPNFPTSTVESHKGKLTYGLLDGRKVLICQGRFHYYEGYNMQQITFPVRVMQWFGIKKLLVSNISGGLNPTFEIGDIMILEDHINLLPDNPLRGENDEQFGPRFPDMLKTYKAEWVEEGLNFCEQNNYAAKKGIYVSIMGPNLETPAEYKFLRKIGADAVGMSTVPEVIAAVHAGMHVFAASIITDLGVEGKIEAVDINKIIKTAMDNQPKLCSLFKHIINN